ncbi:putative ubiquitin-like-specific protease 1B [Iris pallida]|uniref:Ubiquitin-like-specific protease 1B n=1 Tax=Iris pallida TaxID=29817 RepID=A0AAX6EI16_IRIPA|nr:putative ubiquitin-like-specific protease 1B [Iris pallida]
MGPLAETRKRLLSDLPLPADVSTSKKPKLQSHPFAADPPLGGPPHLRRPVHAPQRILRAFGFGSSRKRPFIEFPKQLSRMGNLVSSLFKEKKRENGGFEFEGRSAPAKDPGCWNTGLLGLGRSDLSAAGRREGKVLVRKVADAKTVVQSTAAAVKETFWVPKGPAYKELYELANRRDPKLSSLGIDQNLLEQKLSELRAAREASAEKEKEKGKEELRELFVPLTDEEEEEVSHALYVGSSDELLVTHKASNIEITRRVIRCLDCGGWLNDEVINLYLELLKERERREPNRFLKCHFFNTFFYKKLISGMNGYDFNAVRRWTTKRKLGYGLIECDKIFVPIHKDIHWCLAVINIKDITFQYLDSLGGVDTTVVEVLARYFIDEVKDKNDKQIDISSWKLQTVNNLPMQKNGFDCGMFMLKYTDFYSRGLDLHFSQEHMGYFRKRTAKEILRLRAE